MGKIKGVGVKNRMVMSYLEYLDSRGNLFSNMKEPGPKVQIPIYILETKKTAATSVKKDVRARARFKLPKRETQHQ